MDYSRASNCMMTAIFYYPTICFISAWSGQCSLNEQVLNICFLLLECVAPSHLNPAQKILSSWVFHWCFTRVYEYFTTLMELYVHKIPTE